jgi:hypothetical protein
MFYFRNLLMHVYTPKAIREVSKLIPSKIDRCDYEKNGFGRMYPTSLDKIRTNREFQIRRDTVTKNTPIKKPATHIYTLMDEVDFAMKEFKKGDEISISDFFNDLSIEILCLSMFGEDFFERSGSCQYIKEDGTKKKFGLSEMIQETSEDLDKTVTYAPTHHCPYLIEKNLGEPYQRDQKNITEIHATLRQYLTRLGLIKVRIH